MINANEPRKQTLNYKLRPAKNVERKMVAETIRKVARVLEVEKYCYVGLGSFQLVDFSVFHRAIGITDMVCIENDPRKIERMEFNKPFKCINIKPGDSQQVLPELSWDKPAIVWLDYEDKLSSSILRDVSCVSSCTMSGSIFLVTVNASEFNPPEGRVDDLKSRLQSKYVRRNIKFPQLAGWGLAQESKRIITNMIKKTLANRNFGEGPQLKYQPLFFFVYRDGVQMVTVGGIIATPKKIAELCKCNLRSLRFISRGNNYCEITVPQLSIKELNKMNEQLPHRRPERCKVPIHSTEKKCYARVYRYYPAFVEIDY